MVTSLITAVVSVVVTGGYDPLNRPQLAESFQDGMLLKAVTTSWYRGSRKEKVSGTDLDQTRYVYDKNGLPKEIYFKLPAGGYATPCTYMVNDKQYIVIACGGGGKLLTKPGDSYVAFALPDQTK